MKISDLQFLFRPSYWLMNHPLSLQWDRDLNDLLDKHEFVSSDGFHARIGGRDVWVENYPYAAFLPTRRNTYITQNVRPRRSTILRARKALEKGSKKYGFQIDLYKCEPPLKEEYYP